MSKKRFSDFAFRSYRQRKVIHYGMMVLLSVSAVLVLLPLFSVFIYVLNQGWAALNRDFFTALPAPVGEPGGGVANAIVGTSLLVGLASFIAVPWGVCVGVYLSEYGRGRFASLIRFVVDLFTSTPSIIIGLFIYAVFVIPMKRFSILAGSAALTLIMVPIISRSTEEMLKLVPSTVREAGLALGIPRYRVILRIILRGARSAISTGVILALARVAGESAPLLFTSFNNQFWQRGLDQPVASLPVQIYTYAISPFEDWHQKAWGAALVLVALAFLVNLFARLLLRRKA